MERTYFMSKHHKGTTGLIQLLVGRLSDSGWQKVLNAQSRLVCYSLADSTVILSRTAELWLGQCSQFAYSIGRDEVPMQSYLDKEAELGKSDYVFEGVRDLSYAKFRKQGLSDCIDIISSDSGVYVSVKGCEESHFLVTEFCVQCDDPGVIWTAQSRDGMFSAWSDLDSDEEQDYD